MKSMTLKNIKTSASTNESLTQIEDTMRSMISMAQNGHFPFLAVASHETREVFDNMQKLDLISPHKSKKILYQALNQCRRHKCFQRKITIMENFPFEQKVELLKALITLAEDQKITEGFVIH